MTLEERLRVVSAAVEALVDQATLEDHRLAVTFGQRVKALVAEMEWELCPPEAP